MPHGTRTLCYVVISPGSYLMFFSGGFKNLKELNDTPVLLLTVITNKKSWPSDLSIYKVYDL